MTAREQKAAAWAVQVRMLEQQSMAWIYESESSAVANLARRTLAQAVGLRRLLDQIAGRVSVHREESQL